VKKSKVCSELVGALARAPGVYVIKTGVAGGNQFNPGYNRVDYTFTRDGVPNGANGGVIVVDPSKFKAASEYMGVPWTYGTTLAHELGHVVGSLALISAGMIHSAGDQGCDQICAIRAENAYRGELGIPLRPETRP
jgi:hypothetical protein